MIKSANFTILMLIDEKKREWVQKGMNGKIMEIDGSV